MTCIVGIEDQEKGVVWIGGDSAYTAESHDSSLHREPKVFFKGPFLIGIAGSGRMGCVLRFSFRPPKKRKNQSDFAYIASSVTDVLRKLAKDKGFMEEDTETKAESGNPILVGYNGHLYAFEYDFAAYIPHHGYEAIGIGDNPALGSLFSTEDRKEPQDRVLEALQASAEFCSAVRPPFTVLHT